MAHTILFVDDEAEVLELLRLTFPLSSGYETLVAQSGEEALRLLAERPVDLLVTDQRMPRMTGVELIERAQAQRPDLCAILLTAYTDPRDLVDAINKVDVYRYLVKPWDTGDLRQTVLRALEQSALKREKARLDAELERRLAALQTAAEIARDVGLAGNYGALVERLLSRLPGIVPCDLAAALLAPQGTKATLVIHRLRPGNEQALLQLKDEMLSAWADQGGRLLAEADLHVRVSARPGAAGAARMRSRLQVKLQLAGAPAGLLLLQSTAESAFGEGDARVLDLLANELAESVRALTAKQGEERRRLERVVECMADGLVYLEEKADRVVANPAARRMLGAPDPVEPKWLHERLGFDPGELVRRAAGAVSEELVADGRTLSAAIAAVTDGDGRVAGVALALRDVTAQRELEQRKTELVQVVSHELRTPLTAIRGALDLVLGATKENLQPKQVQFLRMARESAQKLNGIVDDLLDLGKASRGQLRVTPQVCWLDELVRDAVTRFTPAAAERRLRFHLRPPDAPVRIMADPQRLGQVLGNLLQNATKFAPEGSIVEVAVLRSRFVNGWAGFSVWNGGEHIPEEDLERIFGKFEQARTEATRRAGGAGLGLAICKTLVEAHGGRIWAESAPGRGVRMTAAFPVEPPAEAASGGVAAAPADLPPEAPLLLVVDERATADLIRGVAAARSWRCAVATSREEALALARRLRPRAVCLDLASPAVEGPAVAEILRHDPETRDVPLLVFSAPEDRERAFRAGATSFVSRPADATQLGTAIDALARGAAGGDGNRILLVEDDPAIRAVAAEALGGAGYQVETAGTCAEARVALREKRPDLLVSDVMLPDGDGFALLESLRDERAAFPFGVMFLSARAATSDKVRGFRAGADDYLTKPFEPAELIARTEAVLRRRESSLAASPVTRLPGGKAIEREVARRLEAQVPFQLCYLDLDNFKAFNDHYGFAKGDAVMLQTADLLREVVYSAGGEGAFVGHVGGDDFVFVVPEGRADDVCEQVISRFDQIIPLYYDREDRERGFIEADDRYGVRRRFPVMSVSVVSVHAPPGRAARHADLARIAADLKRAAKAQPGSVHVSEEGVAKRRAAVLA